MGLLFTAQQIERLVLLSEANNPSKRLRVEPIEGSLFVFSLSKHFRMSAKAACAKFSVRFSFFAFEEP